jgi:putative tryptophan/tyrosine transport system substrate-binding protein
MKKILLVAVGITLVFSLAGAAYYFLFAGAKNESKTAEKVYHVGILNALDHFSDITVGFKARMAELGYVEGKNIVYDVQKGAHPVGNEAIIKKFVDAKVDLIVAFPTDASIEAKKIAAGSGIPVLLTSAGIEQNNLIDTVRHPGGNITGVRFPIPETAAKRFEIIHELNPKAKRVWIPVLKGYPTVPVGMQAIQARADALHIVITKTEFAAPEEMTAYLKAHSTAATIGMDAILLIAEPLSIIPPYTNQIYAFADAHKLLIVGAEVLAGDKGPAIGLVPSPLEIGQLAAPMADKIFRGTSPGSIPVVTPEFKFAVNTKVLQKLGLHISDSLLSTADSIVH